MSSEKPVLEEGMMGLKDKVLEKQIEFLCEELGDPGRYFPQLKSKGILNVSDCELIRSRVTCREKIQELVGLVKGRRSNKGEHSFDILVDALKKQRVQAHIARGLQKALAKAKEDFSGDAKTKFAEKVVVKSSLQHAQLTSEDVDQKKACDLHPEHGPLPTPPPPFSAQCMTTISYNCYDDNQELCHPLYGQLPTCTKTIDEVAFSTQQSLIWRNSSGLESITDSELGGQSMFTSMPTNVFSNSSLSTPPSSVLESHSNTDDQAGTITALEERIQHLTAQLEAATITIDQKNNLIHKLQAKLDEHEEKAFDEKKLSKQSSSGEVDRPRALKLGPDQQLHRSRPQGHYHVTTTPGSSSSRLVCQDHRGQQSGGGRESLTYNNNYINYSRNGTPIPSISNV